MKQSKNSTNSKLKMQLLRKDVHSEYCNKLNKETIKFINQ